MLRALYGRASSERKGGGEQFCSKCFCCAIQVLYLVLKLTILGTSASI